MFPPALLLALSLFLALPAGPAAPRPPRTRTVRLRDAAVVDLLTIAGAAPLRIARSARERLAAVDDFVKVGPLLGLLEAPPPRLRRYAAAELARIGVSRAFLPLLRRLLLDPDAGVRRVALEGVRALDERRAIRWLTFLAEAHGGGPRAWIQTGRQLSFLEDYDAEVS